jgi:hypothetical protein
VLMAHILRCPSSYYYVIRLHDLIVHVLDEFMAKAGAIKGRNLRLEGRRIWFEASRDRHGDVVWLDFAASYKHLLVDVTATSARINSSVPAPAGGATAAAPEGGAFACPSAPTSTSTRWALVTL